MTTETSLLTCPFCQTRESAFVPYGIDQPVFSRLQVVGGGHRANALCPRCGSMDRERLILLYLQGFTDVLTKPGRILHVGPEKCLRERLTGTETLEYLTADLLRADVDMNIDLTRLPFETDRFDLILCSHVLEHIIDDASAMSELHRVLRPGGLAVLQVPISPVLEITDEDPAVTSSQERLERFGQEDHVRVYGRDYRRRLEAAGFEMELFDWTREARFGGAADYALIDREILYIGRKRMG